MSNRCFVPKCKNTAGAAFPRESEQKQKWLEGLRLTHLTPKLASFVCFAHFDPADLKEENAAGSGRRLSNRLKKGAVPTIPQPAKTQAKMEADLGQENTDLNTKPDDSHGSEKLQNTRDDAEKLQNTEDDAEKLHDSQDVPEVEKVCRACMSDDDLEASMFDFIEDDVTIASVFTLCAFPIEISEQDRLPKHICKACLSTLKIAYKFRKKCHEVDDVLRARYAEHSVKRKRSPEREFEGLQKKNKLLDKPPGESTSSLDVNSSDAFEVVFEESTAVKQSREQPETSDDSATLSPTRRSRRLAHKSDNHKVKYSKLQRFKENVDIDDIEKSMEEIHGNDSKNVEVEKPTEAIKAEALTVKNPETEESTTVEDILNTLEEGTSSSQDVEEDVLEEFLKKPDGRSLRLNAEPQGPKKIVVRSNFPSVVRRGSELPPNIKLPKDVRIRPVQKYVSATGKFPASLRTGVYDCLFIQADEYLFELGLAKGVARHVRCTLPNCGAHGRQKVLENGEFDNVVDVVAPHNHEAPNEATKKKQMFLCVMRKKMQTDRTLNIRHIYEDACMQDPDIKQLVPLRNVINEICRHQLTHKMRPINSFEDFYIAVETDPFEKLHFTHNNQQFYQEKFIVEEEGSMAVVFGNMEVISQISDSKIMYVDGSFKIDTNEDFKYQLVTVLVWIEDSYYPILFILVNKKTDQIFVKVFSYLRDELAPELRPQEIITDYEASLYYSLAEVYIDSNIGGSVFYYTQNLYKKICSLNLSRDLETNSYFRNIYHMLLMLPLLPVNTILDGLNNIEIEAKNLNIADLARPVFDHVRSQWMLSVTPELFCVHKLENRINENVIAPFKKLRDFLLLTKGKLQKTHITILHVIEKIIELEAFLRGTYSKPDKKSFGRDLSSYQKKNVLRAWQFIEDHPKIEINNFFSKVLGYIKCMENQLWIWGFYRFDGDTDDHLIRASNFSILSPNDEFEEEATEEADGEEYLEYIETTDDNAIIMEGVIDQDGVVQTQDEIVSPESIVPTIPQQFETAFLKYVNISTINNF